MYKLLSFDVYGTLVNTPPTNAEAFRIILEEAGAPNIDASRQVIDGRLATLFRTNEPILSPVAAVAIKTAHEGTKVFRSDHH